MEIWQKISSSQQSRTSKITDSLKYFTIFQYQVYFFSFSESHKKYLHFGSAKQNLSSHANLYTVIHQPTGYLIVHILYHQKVPTRFMSNPRHRLFQCLHWDLIVLIYNSTFLCTDSAVPDMLWITVNKNQGPYL